MWHLAGCGLHAARGISSVALRHPSCHIILSVGATFPRYRCGGVLYAPLLLGLSAYMLACDGQSQWKRGVAVLYIYNVQLMLTEERRKIPVPSREWLGTGYSFLLIARGY